MHFMINKLAHIPVLIQSQPSGLGSQALSIHLQPQSMLALECSTCGLKCIIANVSQAGPCGCSSAGLPCKATCGAEDTRRPIQSGYSLHCEGRGVETNERGKMRLNAAEAYYY
jgi:hypothetical protein